MRPGDAIRQQGTGSTLAQVMACCLMAPSHYLNQCWLNISKFLWHSLKGIIIRWSEDTNQYIKIENYIFRIIFRSPRGQWVKQLTKTLHCIMYPLPWGVTSEIDYVTSEPSSAWSSLDDTSSSPTDHISAWQASHHTMLWQMLWIWGA